MDLSFVELWHATGPLARGVVLLLAGMSLTGGAIGTDTWLRLRRAERASDAALAAWRADPSPGGAVATLAAMHPTSPVACMLSDAATVADTAADPAAAREIHDRTVRRHLLATNAGLRKGLGILATVGSTAPFVGLFGTVIGIVNAFHELGASGQGGIATVSTGISEALVTTAFGIVVAIPAVWAFNHLSQRIGRLLAGMECAGEELAVARLAAAPAPRAPRAEGARPWH